MAESEEALQLKRRARRRLVGAIVLVSFVVIILPLLLDKEPGPAGPPLEVQIPKQEAGNVTARIGAPQVQTPLAPAPTPDRNSEAAPPVAGVDAPPGKVEAPAVKTAPAAGKAEASTAKAAPAKALPASAETGKPAAAPPSTPVRSEPEREQPALRDEAWVVALDAFSDAKNVKLLRTKLSAAGVKSYTEPVKTSKGELTRVRAGPFASKEAAEKARAKLQAMGLRPGAVASQ
jgi:DedD protein